MAQCQKQNSAPWIWSQWVLKFELPILRYLRHRVPFWTKLPCYRFRPNPVGFMAGPYMCTASSRCQKHAVKPIGVEGGKEGVEQGRERRGTGLAPGGGGVRSGGARSSTPASSWQPNTARISAGNSWHRLEESHCRTHDFAPWKGIIVPFPRDHGCCCSSLRM